MRYHDDDKECLKCSCNNHNSIQHSISVREESSTRLCLFENSSSRSRNIRSSDNYRHGYLVYFCVSAADNNSDNGGAREEKVRENGVGVGSSTSTRGYGGTQNQSRAEITNNERVATSLVAGALAGAVAKTTIAPLDRTKIFFQTSPTQNFNSTQVIKFLIHTYKSTGFISLWRGNSATMARIVPYAAIQFTAHEQWKRVFQIVDSHSSQNHKTDSIINNNSTTSSELLRFLSGSLAGVTAQSLTYPLDLTRARLAISPKSKYKSLFDVCVKTVKHEGVWALYKGYIPTMLGVIPYAGCSFYCYEGLKRLWVREFGDGSVGGLERLAFGAVSGVLGQSCSYPFDIVRRRMQVGKGLERFEEAKNVFVVMGRIARTEGIIGGLYKGLSMNWIKGPVAAGISFACFDWTQQFLRAHLREFY